MFSRAATVGDGLVVLYEVKIKSRGSGGMLGKTTSTNTGMQSM